MEFRVDVVGFASRVSDRFQTWLLTTLAQLHRPAGLVERSGNHEQLAQLRNSSAVLEASDRLLLTDILPNDPTIAVQVAETYLTGEKLKTLRHQLMNWALEQVDSTEFPWPNVSR